jgi:hypothetical protein
MEYVRGVNVMFVKIKLGYENKHLKQEENLTRYFRETH